MREEEDWRHFHHTPLIVTYQVLFACYLDFEIPNFGLVRFAERTGREQVSCYLAVFLQWLFKKDNIKQAWIFNSGLSKVDAKRTHAYFLLPSSIGLTK